MGWQSLLHGKLNLNVIKFAYLSAQQFLTRSHFQFRKYGKILVLTPEPKANMPVSGNVVQTYEAPLARQGALKLNFFIYSEVGQFRALVSQHY